MDDKTPGIPISAQFAEILSQDIAEFVQNLQEINSPENQLLISGARQAMESDGTICSLSEATGLDRMVAVDGGNNVLSIGAGTQCFILAVRYSLKSGYSPTFEMERFQFEDPEPSGLMYGIRNAMEIQQIKEADEKESFCIVDNSWVSLLETINRTVDYCLKAEKYGRDNDAQLLKSFLDPLLEKNTGAFVSILKNPRNIAISKSGVSAFYCNKYTNKKLALSDKVFLLGILKGGEYTKPITLKGDNDENVVGKLNVHTNEKIFAANQQVKNIYNATLQSKDQDGICLTYFRPYEWSPAKRIEFHKSLYTKDGGTLFKSMLQTVADSMRIPTIQEPLEQFLVDQVVRRHTGKLPDVYQTAGIANIKSSNSQFVMQLIRKYRT
jgi:hypothetical protein